MSWVQPYKARIEPDRLKQLRGIHPYRPTPGPTDFDTLPAFKSTTKHPNRLSSTFGRSQSDRQRTSHLGRRLSKGESEPGEYMRACAHFAEAKLSLMLRPCVSGRTVATERLSHLAFLTALWCMHRTRSVP